MVDEVTRYRDAVVAAIRDAMRERGWEIEDVVAALRDAPAFSGSSLSARESWVMRMVQGDWERPDAIRLAALAQVLGVPLADHGNAANGSAGGYGMTRLRGSDKDFAPINLESIMAGGVGTEWEFRDPFGHTAILKVAGTRKGGVRLDVSRIEAEEGPPQ